MYPLYSYIVIYNSPFAIDQCSIRQSSSKFSIFQQEYDPGSLAELAHRLHNLGLQDFWLKLVVYSVAFIVYRNSASILQGADPVSAGVVVLAF